jgi:hypothetical protein
VLQQRRDELRDVLCNLPVARIGGVDAVVLHIAALSVHVLQQKRNVGNLVLPGERGEDRVELRNVVRTIGWRKRDAGQRDLRVRGLQLVDDAGDVLLCLFEWKAAQAVVATEFHEHYLRMRGDDARQTLHGVLGRVAGYTLVHHAIRVVVGVEQILQVVRKTFAGVGTITGRKAVAKADNQRTKRLLRSDRLLHRNLFAHGRGGFALVRPAAREQGRETHRDNKADIFTQHDCSVSSAARCVIMNASHQSHRHLKSHEGQRAIRSRSIQRIADDRLAGGT